VIDVPRKCQGIIWTRVPARRDDQDEAITPGRVRMTSTDSVTRINRAAHHCLTDTAGNGAESFDFSKLMDRRRERFPTALGGGPQLGLPRRSAGEHQRRGELFTYRPSIDF